MLDIEGTLSSILTVKLDKPQAFCKCYELAPDVKRSVLHTITHPRHLITHYFCSLLRLFVLMFKACSLCFSGMF